MNNIDAKSITNRIIIDKIIDILCRMHVTDPNDIEFINNYQKHESYDHNNSDSVEVLTINEHHNITITSLKIHYIGNDKYCLSHRELCSVLSNDEAKDAVVIVECIGKVLIMKCTELCKEVQRNKVNIRTELMSLLQDDLPSKDINQEIINVTLID